MINNYYNYVRNLLTIIAMLFVYGNVYAQTSQTINAKEVWNYIDFTIGESYTITYNNKSFAANTWEFIGLPFDASKAVLDETFGENNYQIQQFNSMDGNTFVFKAMETPSITAGYPYLIKVTEAVSNPVFANVNFSTGTPSYYGNENVQLYASLITMAGWDLINNHNAYKLINGVLTKMAYNGEGTPEQSDILPPGGYVKTANNSVPSLSIEGSSGSGGGDDPIDPSSMTLQQKIAARMQLTDAPTVYITLPDIGDATLDSYLYKTGGNATTAAEAPYRRASIKVVATDDTTSPHYMESFEEDADHLEIKVRGNSTALPTTVDAKRPYRLKFAKKDKATGQNFKHDMTNAGYSKRNWVLLANALDHSLIRNALTCELGKIVGMPFNPGYKFVDLVINGDYRGTYQISDHPEVDGDRINVDEDTGWYVEFQGRPDMCDYPMCISESGKITMNIKNPEPDDETDESQRNAIIEPIKSWFNDTWVKGFGIGFTNPTTGWRAYNDEDEWLKFLIITEITGDYDGMMSVKAYREVDGKLCLGPVWDKDLAYGNYGDYATTMVADIGNASSVNGYIKKLYSDPLFVKRLKDKMDELVNGGLSATLCSKIDELAGVLTNTRAQNTEKWGVNEYYYMEKIHGLANYEAYIQQLKDWLTARITFVQGQFNQLYTAANTAQEDGLTIDAGKTQSENGIGAELIDKIYNVTLANKSFVQNQWNTISLPFSVNEQTLKGIFGDNYELKELAGIYTNGTTLYFATPKDNAISAGMPYLIKPSKVVEASPIFNNVTLAYCQDWSNTQKAFGENVTFGNYSFCANLYLNNTTLTDNGTDILIGGDAATFTTPTKVNSNDTYATLYGINAYIRIANGAGDPTISFTPEVIAQRTQLTNLPTIYIDTKDNAAINQSSGDWTQAGIQVIDESNTLKPFVYAADAVTAKGKPVFQIRGRGAASWTNAAKKSYRIQFGKDDKDELGNVTTSYKHYLLGDEDAAGVVKKRNWVLLANAGDKTLVRNALTKEIGDAVGLPFTPGYQFVDLVLNGTYVGTYQVTEFIEADANRVNIDEDNGLLIQMTGQADTSTGDHIIAGEDYTKPYLTIKNPEIKTASQAAWNAAFNTDIYDFDGMWNATNGTGLDKSTLVNWYIASEITGNYEALSSIYAYLDATTKNLCFGPLWNNETAFDNHASINMTSEGLMNDAETDDTHNGLLTQAGKDAAWKTKLEELWTRKWFAAAVYERWKELYNNGSLTTTLTGKVDNLAAIVDNTKSSQALNFSPAANGGAGWTITGQGITGYSKDVTNSTYADEVLRLKTYLGQRLPYLDKKFKILGEVDGPKITIGTGGYSSFSWNGALDFSGTGVEVYVATSYVKGILQLEKVADGKIPAETGVILKGNEGEKIYPQTISKSVLLTTDNILLNTAKYTFTVPSENSYYALATLNGKTALYKIQSGITIPLYKAYLSVASQQAPAAIFFGDIDGGTTGLNEISVNADSQHEAVYNLQGRRMKGNLAKGIYIKNGKKFIVK